MKTPRLIALLQAAVLAGALAPAVAADRLTAEFEPMLGADAARIVTGLTDGTAIAFPASTAGAGATVTIESPVGPMGDINVGRTLRVARGQLAGYGIERPTPEQLQAVLTGGDIQTGTGQRVRLDGVLTQRQQNLGWSEIARRAGVSIETLLRGEPLGE